MSDRDFKHKFGKNEWSIGEERVKEVYETIRSQSGVGWRPFEDLGEDKDFFLKFAAEAILRGVPLFTQCDGWDSELMGDSRKDIYHNKLTEYDYPASKSTDLAIASRVLELKTDDDAVYIETHSQDEWYVDGETYHRLEVGSQWSPTRRIGQAEEILMVLRKNGWKMDFSDMRHHKHGDQGWWYELCRYEDPELVDETPIATHYWELDGGGETLSLAICRAGLQAADWMKKNPEDFPQWHENRKNKND